MWIDERQWIVEHRSDLEHLARELTTSRFDLRQAFETAHGTMWVNDSGLVEETCPQEYAILRPGRDCDYVHVQTVVVSWCSASQLLNYLRRADQKGFDTLFECNRIGADRLQYNR
jgi:hypothetical protein